MTAFAGFSPEMFAFFTDLTADNSKAFWQANKKRWERGVRAPMRDALAELAVDFGELRMFLSGTGLRDTNRPCVTQTGGRMTSSVTTRR